MKTKTHTPYIWLQSDEEIGTADCGCELNNKGDDGPALFQCRLHDSAGELLSLLYKALAEIREFHQDSSDEEPCKLDAEIEGAIAKAESR